MTAKCRKCHSSGVKTFKAGIAFARGLFPPVHVIDRPTVAVCLNCGLLELSAPEGPLTELRGGVSDPFRKPVSVSPLRRLKAG